MIKENNLKLTPIQGLLGKKFFIPSYQRGYRWEEQQVKDLLEDINNFHPQNVKDKKEKDTKTFYCLQPIVVKKMQDEKYEVIDGQQRLTTIFMIIHYANEMWIGKQKISEFQIEYKTRDDSFQFLQNLKINESDSSVKIDASNIDFYHMSIAYKAIHEWVNGKKSLDNNDFQSKFRHHTQIIWYELPETENVIDAFTRLNMGKIPLTNAELIKSLFLNEKNFKENEKNVKQIEIAKEWDEIEQTLQNDEFWYFLTTKEPYPTRIELIFEIFSDEQKSDEYAIYRWFQKQNSITGLWSEDEDNIKKVFLTLKHWFENRELYHLIGFLISTGYQIKSIYKEAKDKTKKDFKNWLYDEIKVKIGDVDKIEEIEYGQNDSKIRSTLLLFNIGTLLNEKSSHLRFAFDKYRQEKWSLEHIHPQSESNIPEGKQEEWLEKAQKAIEAIPDDENQKILKEIEIFLKEINQDKENRKTDQDKKEFNNLKGEILELFGDESSDNIDNLTLLRQKDNSSLSNHLFPTKRNQIIKKDRNGFFIPICTKNVFLKYYSSNIQNLYFWSEKDREEYLKNIKETLNQFLNRSQNHE